MAQARVAAAKVAVVRAEAGRAAEGEAVAGWGWVVAVAGAPVVVEEVKVEVGRVEEAMAALVTVGVA